MRLRNEVIWPRHYIFSKYISRKLVLNKHFLGFAFNKAYINFINTFINFIKKSSIKKRIRSRIKTLKKIKISLLLAFDFFVEFLLANSS